MRITTCVLMFALAGAVRAQNAKPAVKLTAEQVNQMTTDYNVLQKEVQQLQAQQQKIQLLLQELQSHDAAMKALTAKLRTWETRLDESRRFTLLSNIMKTKHDTAKNSISNVR